MAQQSPPFALQNSAHSAALFREALTSHLWSAGPLDSVSYVVAQQSTPNMSVQVAGGQAWVAGTAVSKVSGQNFSTQGAYYGLNDAPVTLTIAAADPTNPRIDLVYLQINDQFYSGSLNTAVLGVVTGTPAGTPSTPSTPSNALALATVRVNALATSITNSNIAAVSTGANGSPAVLAGTPIVCTSGTHPTGTRIGQPIFETDTGNLLINTASGFVQYGSTTAKAQAMIYQSAAQTGLSASAFVQINLQSETIDNLGGHSTGPGWTVPAGQGGTYLVDGGVVATNISTANTSLIAAVAIGGSVPTAGQGGEIITSTSSSNFSKATLGAKLLTLTAGQVVTLMGFCTAASWNTGVTSTDASWLSITRVA